MAHSYAERRNMTCPHCGKGFTTDVWLIVDTEERPELVSQIRDRTLHRATCNSCGEVMGQLNAPLLLYLPGQASPVVLSPGQWWSRDQSVLEDALLVQRLRDSLGEAWRDEWISSLPRVRRRELSGVLDGDVDEAVRKMSEETQQRAISARKALDDLHGAQRARAMIDAMLQGEPFALSGGDLEATLFATLAEMLAEAVPGSERAQRLRELERHLMLIPGRMLEAEELPAGTFVEVTPDLHVLVEQAVSARHRWETEPSPEAFAALLKAWLRILASPEAPDHPVLCGDTRIEVSLVLTEGLQRFRSGFALDGAISGLRQALTLATDGSPEWASIQIGLGSALCDRFAQLGELPDLNSAIQVHRAALAATKQGSEEWASVQIGLGSALSNRFDRLGQLEDLQAAIEAYRKGVAAADQDWPEYVTAREQLALTLKGRFAVTGRMNDLDAAIAALREALAVSTEGSHDWIRLQANIGLALGKRFETTEEMVNLEEAIEALRKGVAAFKEDSPDQALLMRTLGEALIMRSGVSGGLDDIDKGIEALREARGKEAEGSTEWVNTLNSLGMALRCRFEMTRHLPDIAQAIEAYDQILCAVETGTTEWASCLNGRSTALSVGYEASGRLAHLDTAVNDWQESLTAIEAGSDEWGSVHNNLGLALRKRFDATGDLSDLDAAIDAHDQALAATRVGTRTWAGYLSNRASALATRFNAQGQTGDLEAAIEGFRQALTRTQPGSRYWGLFTQDLGEALQQRFHVLGEKEDLEAALQACTEALLVAHEGSPDWAARQASVGRCLRSRFEALGQMADLQDSIQRLRGALAVTPEESAGWRRQQLELGWALVDRFEVAGDLNDLEEAIEAYHRAMTAVQRGSSEWIGVQSNLGWALCLRFDALGEVTDLSQGIERFREALASISEKAPDRPVIMQNLGLALTQRFRVLDEVDDLDESVEVLEKALYQVPQDTPIWSSILHNLGATLMSRFRVRRGTGDLRAAIETFEKAANSVDEGARDWGLHQSGLATGFIARFETTGESSDLNLAIEAYRRALSTEQEGSQHWCIWKTLMASALALRFDKEGSSTDAEEAIREYEDTLVFSGPELWPWCALSAAQGLGELHFSNSAWLEASASLSGALDTASTLYRTQLVGVGREALLARTRNTYQWASYALARSGSFTKAAATMEQGRARGLSEALMRDRADLARVRAEDPEVYNRFRYAAARLRRLEAEERTAGAALPATKMRLSPESLGEQALQARADFDAAIARIRRMAGYEHFLAEPDFRDIAAAVRADVPVLYLVTTPAGTLVLAIESLGQSSDAEETTVTPLWLDGFAKEHLHDLVGNWLRSYARSRQDRQSWFECIEKVTQQLWNQVMEFVVLHLHSRGAQEAVLIPAGLLALLPLHAAWTEKDGERRYALDDIAFSYAPSARALTHARRITQTTRAERLFAVDEPRPITHGDRLANSQAEVESIATLFDDPRILRHEQATRSSALTALSQAQVTHFSCHGATNWENPLRSGLLMANDEMLTVEDLFHLQLEGARLATLSACETGIIGTKLPDEVVALPSAFMQAGFAGVVASLWSVADLSTAMLMERFYRLWREEGLAPALALREAQIWLRDTTNREKAEYFKRDFAPVPGVRMPENIAADFYFHVMRQQPHLEHPFWWAAFYLTGV